MNGARDVGVGGNVNTAMTNYNNNNVNDIKNNDGYVINE